jgi:intergrase/recombinase
MSKINLEAPFTAFRGKICKHSKIIFAQRKGTQYTSQICNPRTKAYSAEELARQAKFKSALSNANTALEDSTQKAAYETAFKAQNKYKTLRGFVIAKEYEKLA